MEIKKCHCGNENISLAKIKKDKLWHCICLCCGTYITKGAKTKTEAKKLWNDFFNEETKK